MLVSIVARAARTALRLGGLGTLVAITMIAADARGPAGAQSSGHEHHHPSPAPSAANIGPQIVPISSLAVPHLEFTTDAGKTVDLAEIASGELPVYVNFIYTSCTSVCPVMSNTFASLAATLRQLGTPARLVSVSIDPEYDTPARLAVYAANFRSDAGWDFLTGQIEASVAAQRAFGVYKADKMAHEVTTFFRASGCSRWLRVQGFATADDLAALMGPAGQPVAEPRPHD